MPPLFLKILVVRLDADELPSGLLGGHQGEAVTVDDRVFLEGVDMPHLPEFSRPRAGSR